MLFASLFLPPEQIEEVLMPAGYLGSTDASVDRALALHREGNQ